MELVARFNNQISGPALQAAKDVRTLKADVDAASVSLEGLGNSAAPRGAGGRGAGAAGAGGEAAAVRAAEKAKAAERAKAARENQREGEKIAKRNIAAEKSAQREFDRQRKPPTPQSPGSNASEKLLAAAKFAAVGIGASAVGQLALGYRGVERLTAITTRAKLHIRGLFSGVNPKPFLDTFERVSLLLSKQTVVGRAMSGMIGRFFNGAASGAKNAEPFILDFVKGLVLGALKIENIYLRLRIALFPLTSAIGSFAKQVGVGARVGEVALALMIAKSIGLTSGLLGAGRAALALGGGLGGAAAAAVTLGLALGAIEGAKIRAGGTKGIKQGFAVTDRAAEVRSGATAKIEKGGSLNVADVAKLAQQRVALSLQSLQAGQAQRYQGALGPLAGFWDNLVGNRSYEKQFEIQTVAADAGRARAIATDIESLMPSTSAAGKGVGEAVGDGIIEGMKSKEAAVKAGGAALGAGAAEGARGPAGADAHSPSRKTTRTGRDLGQGVIVGMQREQPSVERAAARFLMPSLPGAGGAPGGAGAARGGTGAPVSLVFQFPGYLGGREELLALLRSAAPTILAEVLQVFGRDPAAEPA